ncbi:thiamine pyrophosphate-binding protein [Chloroflexota bacterium]
MTNKSITAQGVLDELKRCGITHIVCLPDSEAGFMYEVMMNQREITIVPICREGEAIAIAAGLLVGGKKPVVLHQNTGFFEAGDSVRGLALDLQLPLLLLIGYRGWRHDTPLTDSAAIFIEPMLDTWGIKHYLVETDKDLKRISAGYEEAYKTNRPIAILIGNEYQ